jgi:transcriptional antiterminator RfaH
MTWYLIHTKPKLEAVALENLERQGYVAYLPRLAQEKLQNRQLKVEQVPLFPRYCFIDGSQLPLQKGLTPVRSTRGVSKIVSFGGIPALITNELINQLKTRESEQEETPKTLFKEGDRVTVTAGAFQGLEGIYQMTEGEARIKVLIEFMHKSVSLDLAPDQLVRNG